MTAEIVHLHMAAPRPKPMSDEDRKVVETILFGPEEKFDFKTEQEMPVPTIGVALTEISLGVDLIAGQLKSLASNLREIAKKADR